MPSFKLVSDFTPCGDQSIAIDTISHKILAEEKSQVLLGVTGSGKTFTMANIIARINRAITDSGAQQDPGCPAV